MKQTTLLQKLNKPIQALLSFLLIGVVGLLDYLTGYELAFSLFYVLPISLAAWNIGWLTGLAASILSALTWYLADLASGNAYSNDLIPIWNTVIRLSFFMIFTFLLEELQKALKRERRLARVDLVTGADNSRAFHELARREMDRSWKARKPVTLAYLDLDNFKQINDEKGHAAGDDALRMVSETIRKSLRPRDLLARLGGDEFAILLPFTNLEQGEKVVSKVRAALAGGMVAASLPVTFSIGALTFSAPPSQLDTLLREADNLMYEVKANGKNSAKHLIYEDAHSNPAAKKR